MSYAAQRVAAAALAATPPTATVLAPIALVGGAAAITALTYVRNISPPDFLLLGVTAGGFLLTAPALAAANLRGFGGALGAMAGLVVIYVFSFVLHLGSPQPAAVKTIGQILLCFSCFATGFAVRAHPRAEGPFLRLLAPVSLGTVVMLAAMAELFPPTSVLIAKNTLGGMALLFAFLFLAGAERWPFRRWAPLIAGVALAFTGGVTDHRVLLALAPTIPLALYGLQLIRSRALLIAPPLAGAAVAIFSVLFITSYRFIPGFSELNGWAYQTLGRQLTSGRERMWGPLMNAIMNEPWFGHGPNAAAQAFTGLTLSAHNSFLHLALQAGLTGLLAVSAIFASLARRAVRSPRAENGVLLSVYLGVLLIYASFEATLFANVFAISAVIWLTLGVLAAGCAAQETSRR